MLMRLIDGDALVYELTEMVRHDTGEYKYGIVAARLAVMEAPTVGDWIKCTPDTMPETNDEVLTTYIVNGNKKRRFVEAASCFYDGEEWYWTSAWDEYRVAGTRKEVLAWMPMPKPYNPSKED